MRHRVPGLVLEVNLKPVGQFHPTTLRELASSWQSMPLKFTRSMPPGIGAPAARYRATRSHWCAQLTPCCVVSRWPAPPVPTTGRDSSSGLDARIRAADQRGRAEQLQERAAVRGVDRPLIAFTIPAPARSSCLGSVRVSAAMPTFERCWSTLAEPWCRVHATRVGRAGSRLDSLISPRHYGAAPRQRLSSI